MPQTIQTLNERRVREALVALLHRGEQHSFVVVHESLSHKFVQFGHGRSIAMDVPMVALSDEEADRAFRFFARLGEEGPREYHAPDLETGRIHHGATFFHDFVGDTRTAARTALSFFSRVYRCSEDAELLVEEY